MSIAKMLRCGERMDAPDNSACSSEVYRTEFIEVIANITCSPCRYRAVMQQCWEGDPDRRPTFSQLVTTIDTIVTPMAGYMELSVFSKYFENEKISD